MLLPLAWVTCGVAVVVAAVRSRRHPAALRLGRWAIAGLYIGAGAAVNAGMLAAGEDYATFAEGSYLPFVRDTWADVVVPHHEAWIGLLIAFELTVGVLALLGGRATQVAYGAIIAFHVALLGFGWGFYLWAVPIIAAVAVLLRAERRAQLARRGEPHGGGPTERRSPAAAPPERLHPTPA